MPSLRSTIASVAVLAAQGVLGGTSSCSSAELSCSNDSSDTCCTSSPGGLLLQTQFWDTNPSTGPSDKWTIHGLWPDACDGSYVENCDPSRDYTNITQILQSQGRNDLLNTMNQVWIPNDTSNEDFWEHEWSTHGTCISTYDPSCYTDYVPQQEVGEFFQTVVDLWGTLDTYTTLANAGITPDSSATYALSDVQNALNAAQGYQVYIGCSSGAISQVYYAFYTNGPVADGSFVATDVVSSGNCPSTVSYLPK